MKNTETKKIIGGGYSSPEVNIISARFEQGFCQSQIDTRAKIEDWNEDTFVW